MTEYKDIETALQCFQGWLQTAHESSKTELAGSLEDCILELQMLPTADVSPVIHAQWEYEGPTINDYSRTKCTRCGWWTLDPSVSTVYNYCPNCGAKMDLQEVTQ